jgi:hypothetical protein
MERSSLSAVRTRLVNRATAEDRRNAAVALQKILRSLGIADRLNDAERWAVRRAMLALADTTVTEVSEPVRQWAFRLGDRMALLTRMPKRKWAYRCGWQKDPVPDQKGGTTTTKAEALIYVEGWLEDAHLTSDEGQQ